MEYREGDSVKLYAVMALTCAAAWVGFEFGVEVGRQRVEHRRALEVNARPKVTTTAFLLPCPAMNVQGVQEWHRTCRARARSERLIKGK
jgi:hypothetical protein